MAVPSPANRFSANGRVERSSVWVPRVSLGNLVYENIFGVCFCEATRYPAGRVFRIANRFVKPDISHGSRYSDL